MEYRVRLSPAALPYPLNASNSRATRTAALARACAHERELGWLERSCVAAQTCLPCRGPTSAAESTPRGVTRSADSAPRAGGSARRFTAGALAVQARWFPLPSRARAPRFVSHSPTTC